MQPAAGVGIGTDDPSGRVDRVRHCAGRVGKCDGAERTVAEAFEAMWKLVAIEVIAPDADVLIDAAHESPTKGEVGVGMCDGGHVGTLQQKRGTQWSPSGVVADACAIIVAASEFRGDRSGRTKVADRSVGKSSKAFRRNAAAYAGDRLADDAGETIDPKRMCFRINAVRGVQLEIVKAAGCLGLRLRESSDQ